MCDLGICECSLHPPQSEQNTNNEVISDDSLVGGFNPFEKY